MALTITTTQTEDGRARVTVEGEIDVSCADELRDALDAALATGNTGIEVDLAQVPYIDSTGIGVLVGAAHRALDAGSRLVVVGAQRNVSRIFGLLGIDRELGLSSATE